MRRDTMRHTTVTIATPHSVHEQTATSFSHSVIFGVGRVWRHIQLASNRRIVAFVVVDAYEPQRPRVKMRLSQWCFQSKFRGGSCVSEIRASAVLAPWEGPPRAARQLIWKSGPMPPPLSFGGVSPLSDKLEAWRRIPCDILGFPACWVHSFRPVITFPDSVSEAPTDAMIVFPHSQKNQIHTKVVETRLPPSFVQFETCLREHFASGPLRAGNRHRLCQIGRRRS